MINKELLKIVEILNVNIKNNGYLCPLFHLMKAYKRVNIKRQLLIARSEEAALK
ncbi:MAG: hypothetical protein M0P37_03335 [Synergistaceae bacterium]|jgi:hypothetical protein|nr:hypothetical protein [Synergistaceae bacterium]MDD2350100.1 hypothetical protein [Synergistaceae bacterium]MDD3319324.1 hypothetical protein [Synergistaceae bacterium]MDD3671968.1 hypothetical protein [Synergistaceae bacterium]MDD3963923.1 hypothetical protein [Synergistaceae bacterium]